jgi:hypothetical protein
MPRCAPRYDPRILGYITAAEDVSQPMAETCRQIAAYAESLGLPRPSYSHLRRFVRAERDRVEAERARSAAIRRILAEVYGELYAGGTVDPYELADRIRTAGA